MKPNHHSNIQHLRKLSEMSTFYWYAIHVKSKHEFKVHERLAKAGVETFLPAVERLRRWKDRKKLVTFPLFPGYLFVHISRTNGDKLTVLKTQGIVNFISMDQSEPTPVPDDQLKSLKLLVDIKKSIDPYPYLKEGQMVKIKKGPLAGAHGIIVKKETQHIFVVSIDILRKGLCINIDASDLDA